MQIQWINSRNQAFGFTIKFVRGGLHQRESDREVLWFSLPKFLRSASERLSRCGVNALSGLEHLGLLVEKETLSYPMDAALVEHQMTLSHRHASIHSTLTKDTL
jgi:hypothetical protein